MLRLVAGLCVLALSVGSTQGATKRAAAKSELKPTAIAAAAETTMSAPLDHALAHEIEKSPLAWYDASLLTIEGKGWTDTPTTYSRLPVHAQSQVTSTVWHLSHNPAGMCIHFATNATTIGASWTSSFRMSHMARTGSSGVDLYRRKDGQWEFFGVGKPAETTRTTAVLTSGLAGQMTEYLLFLPLYDQLTDLQIGVSPEAVLAPVLPSKHKPIVFYGTSVTEGGCASRAGMCHTSILSRWLNWPVVNLGFSGSGKSEPGMQEVVSEIDAAAFVLEPLPNMTVEQVKERIPGFVKLLRKKHPTAPILLVENPLFSTTSTTNLALRQIFDEQKKKGVRRLHYLYGEAQLAGRENATVDGVHPTDLGFLRMATVYEPMLKMMLAESGAEGGTKP